MTAVRQPALAMPPSGYGRRRVLILMICCMSLFMVGLDNTIVNIGLPLIRRTWHAPVSDLQWTIDAYTIVLATLLMLSGTIADRVGRRAIFQLGIAVFTFGSWLCSLAPSLHWLIAFRAVQAIGGSMLNPAALGIITNTFTDRASRARAIGVWDGVFGLSMALGPVLGGVLAGLAGWRAIFWANIPVGLAAIALTALFVPDSSVPRFRRPDPAGQVLVTVALGALAYAIIEGPGVGWSSPRIYGSFLLAAATLAVLAGYESRRQEPMIDPRFFRSVPFTAATLTAVCAVAAMAGFLFLSTLYLQDVRGFSALNAGLRMLPMPLVMAAFAPLAGLIVARRGARAPLLIAGAALMASSVALERMTDASSAAFLIAAYGTFGIGCGMVNSPITNGVMSGIPDGQAGLASGISSASRQVGQVLGVAVVGSILASSLRGPLSSGFVSASRASWWVLGGCGCAVFLLGLISTSRWAKRTQARTETPPPAPDPWPVPGTGPQTQPLRWDGYRWDH
jgi:EmrB/QacA subfamily drug resistance transporter